MLRNLDELPVKGLRALNPMKIPATGRRVTGEGNVSLELLWVLCSAGKGSLRCQP